MTNVAVTGTSIVGQVIIDQAVVVVSGGVIGVAVDSGVWQVISGQTGHSISEQSRNCSCFRCSTSYLRTD